MGTRGSSSHGGHGGGGPPFARVGRDQLAPWRDNATAFQQILRDTGYTPEQARIAQEAQIRFYGDDYDTFTSGDLPHETEIISEALMRMPYYNAGAIYRGISMPSADAQRIFLDQWKPGTVQMFTDKAGKGTGIVQSFSSKESVANSFGNWEWTSRGSTSIRFILDDNKTAPGVQHISKFGAREAEVLSPSYHQFYVDKVVQMPDSRYGGQRYEIHLKDRGRKKK